MNPLRILFVVPYAPSLIRVRPYNLIRFLSERGHKVTVLTIYTDDQERDAVRILENLGVEVKGYYLPRVRSYLNCIKALPTIEPLQAVYCWQPEMARFIAAIAAKVEPQLYDIVHVEHLRGARYGLEILRARLQTKISPLPVVWDSVDCISYLFEQSSRQSKDLLFRLLTAFELCRTRRYEGWLVKQFDRVLITSNNDRRAILDLAGQSVKVDKVTVLPNGVDLDYFCPDHRILRDEASLVVSGKMSYHANVTMVLRLVKDIMPYVWKARPEVKLRIVGKDPTAEIMALSKNPAVTVTGTVKDIRPYLQRATIAVAPVAYGAGIQNKVLEAMACATPVVCSRQAVSALDVHSGVELLYEDNAEKMAGFIIELLANPEKRNEVGQAGYQFVQAQHNWRKIIQNLEYVYENILLQIPEIV